MSVVLPVGPAAVGGGLGSVSGLGARGLDSTLSSRFGTEGGIWPEVATADRSGAGSGRGRPGGPSSVQAGGRVAETGSGGTELTVEDASASVGGGSITRGARGRASSSMAPAQPATGASGTLTST